MLTAAGVGSGLDIDSIISQLMVLESRPLERLQQQRAAVDLQISANGTLRSAIARLESAAASLADTDKLGGVVGNSSDEDVVGVTASLDVDPQTYLVDVTQIATSHRMTTSAFADADTEVGSGDLTIEVDGESMTLSLATGSNTLRQIKDAINASEDNPGVTASLISVDAGTQLVLTSDETGLANEITITKDSPGLDPLTFSQVGTLQDAEFTIDGLDVTSSSNTVVDAIEGVTLTLGSVGTSTVSFATDAAAISEAVQSFVNEYNNLRANITGLREGVMSGDSTLLSLESRLSREISDEISLSDDTKAYMFELGVSFNDVGDLTFDQSKLTDLVAADPVRVLDIFSAEDSGLAVRIENVLKGYTEDGGVLASRNDVLESRTRGIDRQIGNAQYRLGVTEERLRAEFTALDTLISQLNVTSGYLAQQLASLPQVGSSNS